MDTGGNSSSTPPRYQRIRHGSVDDDDMDDIVGDGLVEAPSHRLTGTGDDDEDGNNFVLAGGGGGGGGGVESGGVGVGVADSSQQQDPTTAILRTGSYYKDNPDDETDSRCSHEKDITSVGVVGGVGGAAAGGNSILRTQLPEQQQMMGQRFDLLGSNGGVGGQTISPSRTLSRSSSKDEDDHGVDWDDDDDDDFDDEAGLRRYRGISTIPHADMPLPAEFHHRPLPVRLWNDLSNLRVAARQRRAARLLKMPSDSAWPYKLYSCTLTWCCDATDQSISLVAILLVLWILIGWMGSVGYRWWLIGTLCFALRVSARRIFESCQSVANMYWRILNGGGGGGGGSGGGGGRQWSPNPSRLEMIGSIPIQNNDNHDQPLYFY